MTLCAAAVCECTSDRPKIVLCLDRQVSTLTSKAEIQTKIEPIRAFNVMFSGTISAARELIAIYKTAIVDGVAKLSLDAIVEQLRIPIQIQKRRMIEALVRRRTGLGYEEFLEHKDQLDTGIRAKIFNALDELQIEADLLFCGFLVTGRPVLFRQRFEEIENCDHFGCIGAGESSAEQSLYRRRQSMYTALPNTLYNLYEAKKLSEGAPSVGAGTIMFVMEASPSDPSGSLRAVSSIGLAALEECFQRFGPQPAANLPKEVADLTLVYEPAESDEGPPSDQSSAR